MGKSDEKQWASQYLLDPLNEPAPSEETGPGTHYSSTFHPVKDGYSARSVDQKKVSDSRVRITSLKRSDGYPTPPTSTSPRSDSFPSNRSNLFPLSDGASSAQRRSVDQASSAVPTSTTGRRRNSSISSKHPGDFSQRPLEIIKRETKAANRAPHLQKRHLPGADTIDSLDTASGSYHHDGPYDATLLARNTSHISSPINAVSTTTAEALKATPREKIIDSLEKHRPLDGVAMVPPGMRDRNGHMYNYQEGTDMMIEDGGNYKRWPGVKYLPEDLKGKGEPSFSLERALKDHRSHRRVNSDGQADIEMTDQPHVRRSKDGSRTSSTGQGYVEWERELHGGDSIGRRASGGLKKRFGSLRHRKQNDSSNTYDGA